MTTHALPCIAQPNTTLYDCICQTKYAVMRHITRDPGSSLGSANQCILGDVCLRSNLSTLHAFCEVADDLNVLPDVSKLHHLSR